MDFKEGDTIKMNGSCSGNETGDICVLHMGAKDGTNKDKLFAWGHGGCSCHYQWTLIKHFKEVTMDKIKWGIKYEQSSDPVEFFSDKKEAEKRIRELLKDKTVNLEEVYLFEVGTVYQVSVPVTYKLVTLKKEAK